MSKEDCFRPIRGDVWYFSTKRSVSGLGSSLYRAGNLGIRLVEVVENCPKCVLKIIRD
jgi:hypothetical protein